MMEKRFRTPEAELADQRFSEKISRIKQSINKPYIPYKDQLNDNRWLARREEIISRDGHKCRGSNCDKQLDGENPPLQVHHKYYEKGLYAWEYPDHALITLCAECHSVETELLIRAYPRLLRALSFAGYTAIDIVELCEKIENAS